jgi:hypothetical protein
MRFVNFGSQFATRTVHDITARTPQVSVVSAESGCIENGAGLEGHRAHVRLVDAASKHSSIMPNGG